MEEGELFNEAEALSETDGGITAFDELQGNTTSTKRKDRKELEMGAYIYGGQVNRFRSPTKSPQISQIILHLNFVGITK